MKAVSLSTAVLLSASALTFAARPALAIGGLLTPFQPGATPTTVSQPTPPPSPASGAVGPPTNPPTTALPPSPAAGAVTPPNPGQIDPSANYQAVQYQPQALNLGVVRAYFNEEKKAVLTIRTPTTGSLSVELAPRGPFRISRITSYNYTSPSPVLGGVTGGQGSPATSLPRVVAQNVTSGSTLSVQAGQEIEVEIALQATDTTPWQPRATLHVHGPEWYFSVAVGAYVLQQPEVEPQPQVHALRIAPGGETHVPIRLVRNMQAHLTGPSGLTRTVTLRAQNLPAGVAMDPVSVLVPVGVEYVDTVLRFQASDDAPPRRDQLTRLLVDSGADRMLLDLPGHVYPKKFTWKYVQKSGDVNVKGELTIRADGTWKWKANVHDSGTVLGDWFGTGVAIHLYEPHPLPPGHAPVILLPTFATGYLGGGVLGGSQDQTIEMSHEANPSNILGPLPKLKQHYCDAVDAGLFIETKATADFGPLVKLFVNTIWEIVGPAAGISQ